MKTDNKHRRMREIEAAAYELLAEKGYKATSMLAIARRASASNETLYKWYGTKQALFASLVQQNAADAKTLLEDRPGSNTSAVEMLREFGAILLKVVTGEQAITLNRAAAGDVYETGLLGQTIFNHGKGAITPLLHELVNSAQVEGDLEFNAEDEPVETYISLLIGDLQIARAIGVLNEPSDKEIQTRSDRVFNQFLKLFGSKSVSGS